RRTSARLLAECAGRLASDVSFFFQAEDGIRDFHVTGVQTCALPISSMRSLISNCLGRTPYSRYLASSAYSSEAHRASPHLKYPQDRKSTRLNSSHVKISYAVFCLKKKKKKKMLITEQNTKTNNYIHQ